MMATVIVRFRKLIHSPFLRKSGLLSMVIKSLRWRSTYLNFIKRGKVQRKGTQG